MAGVFVNKYFCGNKLEKKLCEINKWPQGMVEIQPILR